MIVGIWWNIYWLWQGPFTYCPYEIGTNTILQFIVLISQISLLLFFPQIPSNYQSCFYQSIKVSYFLLFSYRHVQYSSLGKWNIFYHEILYFSKSRFIIAVWSFHLREFSVIQVKELLFVLPSLAFLPTLLNKIKRCDKRRH